MPIRRAIKFGLVGAMVLGVGYLLGSGTIGDVLNIGESKIGAASIRADNEEFDAQTGEIAAQARRDRAEAEAALQRSQRNYVETMGSDVDPEFVRD